MRAALDMMADAVKFRLKTLSAQELTSIDTMNKPLVTMKEHLQACKLVQDNLSERIRDLPLFGKIVLCVLVTLARESVLYAKIKDLKECVTACLVDFPDYQQDIPSESFKDLVDMLVDQNLLKMNGAMDSNKRMGMPCSQYELQVVRLGTQLDDVCEVIQKDLVQKQSFWSKIEFCAREHWKLTE